MQFGFVSGKLTCDATASLEMNDRLEMGIGLGLAASQSIAPCGLWGRNMPSIHLLTSALYTVYHLRVYLTFRSFLSYFLPFLSFPFRIGLLHFPAGGRKTQPYLSFR